MKRWTTKEGRKHGGGRFDKHTLSRMLRNPAYVAEVHFEGGVYPAEHEAIVDRETWDGVQALLRESRPQRRSTSSPYLLAAILRCEPCDAGMTPAWSGKNGRRYRYYTCLRAQKRGWASCPTKSVPARQIEGRWSTASGPSAGTAS